VCAGVTMSGVLSAAPEELVSLTSSVMPPVLHPAIPARAMEEDEGGQWSAHCRLPGSSCPRSFTPRHGPGSPIVGDVEVLWMLCCDGAEGVSHLRRVLLPHHFNAARLASPD
jgi:hypothetical protein